MERFTIEAGGAKLRNLREAMGLTRKDLGDRMSRPVTPQAVEQWERLGIRSFRVLNAVAKALGVHPEVLIRFDKVSSTPRKTRSKKKT